MLESSAFFVDPANWESKVFSESFFVRAVRRAALTGSKIDAGIPLQKSHVQRQQKPRYDRSLTVLFGAEVCYLRSSCLNIGISACMWVLAVLAKRINVCKYINSSYRIEILRQTPRKNHSLMYRIVLLARMLTRPKGSTTVTNSLGIELYL